MAHKDGNSGSSNFFQSSIRGLAEVFAIASTFFGAPIAFNATIEWVELFTLKYYGDSFVTLVGIAWMGIVGAGIYFASRATIGTALTAFGVAFALRFLI